MTEWDAHELGEQLASVALIRGHLELGYTYQTVQTVEVNRLLQAGREPRTPPSLVVYLRLFGGNPRHCEHKGSLANLEDIDPEVDTPWTWPPRERRCNIESVW